MTVHELQTLVDYHYWARDRLLDAAATLTAEQFTRPLGSSFSSVRDTLVHLYGADWVWCSRWEGGSPAGLPGPEPFPDLPSIRAAWAAQEGRVRAVLRGLGDDGIMRPIEYRMFTGQLQAQPFWQQLQHLVNHGSYHRGHVTTMLRQLGAAPAAPMDLMAFYRERAAVT
jgi:uncharacterized damage-inducible protein DinB